MEKDDEVTGVTGSHLNYKFRMYDSRIGKFFAVDPLTAKYPELTPFQFASNSPIWMREIEGLEGTPYSAVIPKKVRIYATMAAYDNPTAKSLIHHFGYGEGETYEMPEEEMKNLAPLPVSVMDFDAIQKTYSNMDAGETKLITTTEYEVTRATSYGTLGSFAIQIGGKLTKLKEGGYSFDGAMRFVDNYDFDVDLEEKEWGTNVRCFFGQVFIPGNNFIVKSVTVPAKENSNEGAGIEWFNENITGGETSNVEEEMSIIENGE